MMSDAPPEPRVGSGEPTRHPQAAVRVASAPEEASIALASGVASADPSIDASIALASVDASIDASTLAASDPASPGPASPLPLSDPPSVAPASAPASTDGLTTHAPFASHVFVPLHVSGSSALVTSAHAPVPLVHVLHVPLHGPEQQTPSSQTPETQSPPTTQAAPV
jgi:hypothetical protein